MKVRVPQPARIFALAVLGYIFTVLVLSVIEFLSGAEFRAILADIVKCINGLLIAVSPLLAAVSVVMGAWSIHQSNEGGVTMKKTVEEMQKVIETLRQLSLEQHEINVSVEEIKQCVQGNASHVPLAFSETPDSTT